MQTKYTIQAYSTPNTSRGCDCDSDADTLKEARAKARHYISEAYRLLAEASHPLSYARVVNTATGECVFDCFRAITPRLIPVANGLAAIARNGGLYSDPAGGNPVDSIAPVCFDDARPYLGYPDGIEVHGTYTREWVKLTAKMQLADSNGQPVGHPAAPGGFLHVGA